MDMDSRELEEKYAYPSTGQSWMRSNFVSTLDGAAFGTDGVTGSLGGPSDTQVFALLRSLADVILVGAGTARAEGYRPLQLSDAATRRRERLGLSPAPALAIATNSLDIPDELIAPGQIIVTTVDAPPAQLDRLRDKVDVIAHGEGEVDWASVKASLAEAGMTRILCEGGPTLHGTLVSLDLVDELCLSLAPTLSAGAAPRIAHSLIPVQWPMKLGHCIHVDDLLLTRWVRNRD